MNAFAARYLYGLERPLPRQVIEAYVSALAALARADGIVESESRIIQGVAEILGAPPFTVSRALEDADPGKLSSAVATLRTEAPGLIDLLYRDAILVTRADGRFSDAEKADMLRISAELGLDQPRRKRATDAADGLLRLQEETMGLVGSRPGA